jgi:hypothetical protein
MISRFSPSERQFEEYLRDAITAVKTGNRGLAVNLLNRALILNKHDARPYIWLSATTKDPQEQLDYLEQAVAADPTNATARRGLATLSGKIDKNRLAHHGSAARRTAAVQQGETSAAQTFGCPQCGGRMSYSLSTSLLTCEYCGYEQPQSGPVALQAAEPLADRAEQVLDFALPTALGHNWAQDRHRLSCERCGAISLLAPGEKATQCAYCGSHQLIDLSEQGELIDPQVIAVMQVDADQAIQNVRAWLGRGIFTPDNLLSASNGLRLRPAYYSAWTFDGMLEIQWSCEVREGSGRYAHWVTSSGVETRFFNDVLVSGVRSLTSKELASLEPFNLADVEPFKPEFLAGWPTIIYDRSLADASLVGREQVVRQIRPQMYNMIALGREKRNLQIGSGNWSGMTYKHVLLPIWIGTYRFKGQEFHLLVNGQTGKVGGKKPRDTTKITLGGLSAVLLMALVVVLYIVLRSALGAP